MNWRFEFMDKKRIIIIFSILFVLLGTLSAVAANDLNSTDAFASEITDEGITETQDSNAEHDKILTTINDEQDSILDVPVEENEGMLDVPVEEDEGMLDVPVEEQDSISDVVDGEQVSIPDSTNEYESDEWGTFAELRSIISSPGGNMITLSKNYRSTGSGGSSDEIVIDRQMTINGNGHTIDCAGKSTAFVIAHIGVVLTNLRITGFTDTSIFHHYAVSFKSGITECKIENCIFEGNSYSLLYFAGSKNRVINCTFRNNSAEGSELVNARGQNQMSGCTFVDNGKFTPSGGYDTDKVVSLSDEFLVEDCLFENNVAKKGIINIRDSIYGSNVIKCFFGAAETADDYGLIYCDGPSRITESIFSTPDIKGNVINGHKSLGLSYNLWLDGTKSYEYPKGIIGSVYGHETRYEPYIVTGYERVRIPGSILSRYIYVPTIPKEVRLGDTIELKLMFLKSDDTLLKMPHQEPLMFEVNFSDSNLNSTNITFINDISTPFNYTALEGKEGTINIFYKGAIISSLKITHAGEYDSLTLLKHSILKASNEINFTHDYKFYSSVDNSTAIDVDKDITINGNGYTIDGCNGANGIFKFASGRNITVKNLNFINIKGFAVNAESSGDDNITFINCTFKNIGGGIKSDKITIISNCEFENSTTNAINLSSTQNTANIIDNSTFENCRNKYDGGAGYINSATVITNSKFKNNYARNGGGLYIDAQDCVVDNCEFIGNEADYIAGGAYFNKENCNLTNSIFTNNSAASNAAFFFTTTQGTVEDNTETNSTITKNSFKDLKGIIDSAGNVINLETDYKYKNKNDAAVGDGIPIEKSIIINGNGHTLDGDEYATFFEINGRTAEVTFNNIEFVNGFAFGVYIKSAKSVTFNNCTFYSTEGEENGADAENNAVIYIKDQLGADSVTDSVLINRCSFIDNDIYNIILANSGSYELIIKDSAFANPKSTYDLSINSHFHDNNLDYNWWGNTADNFSNMPKVKNAQLNNWYFLNTTLKSNNATISLNNLYVKGDNSITKYDECNLVDVAVEFIGKDLVIDNNAVIKNGNLIVPYKTIKKPAFLTTKISDINYTANITEKGQFDLLQELIDNATDNTINLTQDYTIIEDIDSVGGITINKDHLIINGNGHTINGLGIGSLFNILGNDVKLMNLVLINGSSIIFQSSPIQWMGNYGTMENCTISDNFANNGVLTWTGAVGRITNSIFSNNIGNSSGGAIYFDGTDGIIANSNFNGNRAFRGAAIYSNKEYTHIYNCTFIKNEADYGGAVYLNWKNGKIINSRFENNTGKLGGAIYLNDVGCIVTTSNFTFNKAKDGGAIYWDRKNGEVSDCEFANNTATEDGGAIYWNANNGTVNSSSFENNTAKRGGAIYWDYDYGKVIESSFINNTATEDGGAIYFCEGFIIKSEQQTVDQSIFSENIAQNNGGAIYMAAKKSSIGNSTFIKNQAQNGGALYSTFEDGTISKLVFINNTASDKGSAIYADEEDTPVNYCIFINNGENTLFYNDTSWFGSTLNADYNWFGNNITNYNAAPPVSDDVACDYWYFMDITMADGIANISLNNIYDKNNTRILTGQHYGLQEINLTLTNENLDVPDSVSLDENGTAQVAYMPKSTQTSLKVNYDIAQITVNKDYLPGTVTIGDEDEFDYGSVSIEFSVENPTIIEIIIKNEDNETVLNTTSDERTLNPDLAAGTYTITITNIGNDDILQSKAIKIFKVNKLTPIISVSGANVIYPGDLLMSVVSVVSGEYSVNVGNQEQVIDLTANVAKELTFTGLSANEYTIVVSYNETENYTGAVNDTVKVSVLKATPVIAVSGDSVTYPNDLIVHVTSDVGGRYFVKVGTHDKAIDLTANVAKEVIFSGLSANEYTIIVSYNETENYTGAVNDTVKVNVSKATPTITVSAANVTYPGDLIVTINTDASGKYNITVGSQTKTETLTAGANSVRVTGLKVGNYTISVEYGGNENYTSATDNSAEVSVLKNESFEPTITATNTANETIITFTFPEDATGNVTVIVDGKTYNATVENGKAIITTPLISLDSIVDFEYSGDENYPAKSKETSIANVTVILKAQDMTRGYNSGLDYQVTVVDGNGNPIAKKQIRFAVNGKEYSATTNAKGVAVLNIKLAVGLYKVTVVNPLNNDKVTKTLRITTRITGNKNVNTYYAKNYAYKLRIIGENGKAVGSNVAVKVTVNGKAQTLKTDKNGYITLKFTKKYLPKTYKVTAEYKGIKVTNKVKVKQILKLKKVKVRKSAKKLVLKATLKQGKKPLKNKKVTFKFKGKKYKAKTNKKGIAKVTIKKSVLKKLKVGKKITYKVTYLKDTVKRKVKVKK